MDLQRQAYVCCNQERGLNRVSDARAVLRISELVTIRLGLLGAYDLLGFSRCCAVSEDEKVNLLQYIHSLKLELVDWGRIAESSRDSRVSSVTSPYCLNAASSDRYARLCTISRGKITGFSSHHAPKNFTGTVGGFSKLRRSLFHWPGKRISGMMRLNGAEILGRRVAVARLASGHHCHHAHCSKHSATLMCKALPSHSTVTPSFGHLGSVRNRHHHCSIREGSRRMLEYAKSRLK